MSLRRVVPAVLLLAAVVLAIAAVLLAFDNPEVADTSRGDHSCLAPWDTALNGADNFPGGEPPADGQVIASRCRAAGNERFDLAYVAGVAALGALVAGATLGLGRTTYGRRRALVAAAALATVAVAAWGGWERQHPTTFTNNGISEGIDLRPGPGTIYFGVNWPRNPDHDVVIRAADVDVTADTAASDVAVVVCVPAGPDSAHLGNAFESSISKFCSRLVPVGPADVVLSSTRKDQLLIRLSTTRPGRVKIAGVDLHYRDGWRQGHQDVAAEVRATQH